MAEIYLASYKGKVAGLAGIFGAGTRWLTRSEYSHSEACIGNPFDGSVACVSSSPMDGGVRCKIMQLDQKSWDVEPMPWVSDADVLAFLRENKGTGYDWLAIVRFMFPWMRSQSKAKWFCTEAVASIAGYQDPWRFSPADFHIIVQARNK